MKRVPPLLVALIGLLLGAQAAPAQVRQGGYDEATRQLEAGFKIVATQRVFADNECYPGPAHPHSAQQPKSFDPVKKIGKEEAKS